MILKMIREREILLTALKEIEGSSDFYNKFESKIMFMVDMLRLDTIDHAEKKKGIFGISIKAFVTGHQVCCFNHSLTLLGVGNIKAAYQELCEFIVNSGLSYLKPINNAEKLLLHLWVEQFGNLKKDIIEKIF